jgi:hypothetical protein
VPPISPLPKPRSQPRGTMRAGLDAIETVVCSHVCESTLRNNGERLQLQRFHVKPARTRAVCSRHEKSPRGRATSSTVRDWQLLGNCLGTPGKREAKLAA